MIDDVPMAIDDKFLGLFSKNLQEFLLSKLGIGAANASARCAAYLAEDPGVAAAREALLAKSKRVGDAIRVIGRFGL